MTFARSAPAGDRQTYKVVAKGGIPIVFDYYPVPDSGVVVLVVPGFWRNRTYSTMVGLAERLRAAGVSVTVMDVRGHGDSGGVYGFNHEEHHDVAAVIEDLVARGARDVLLVGFSIGGAIAVSTVSRHPELPVRGLVLVSAVSRFRRVLPRLNPFTMHRHLSARQALRKPRFVWNFWRSEKLVAEEEIANVAVPVHIIHCRNDWLVDHRHAERLHAAARPPKQLHLLDVGGRFHADRLFMVKDSGAEELLLAAVREIAARCVAGPPVQGGSADDGITGEEGSVRTAARTE